MRTMQRTTQKTGTTRTLSTVRDSEGAITSRVRRTVLPGGLRVVTEQMAGARSATIGVWVDVGSRDETTKLHGCSHFLEHLLFKGTHERSALDISVALDAVGGEFNAFTAKEYTCFHARVLDEDLPLAVDVLGDMITSSLLSPDDVEAEREVILDEIAMHDDDPDDVVHNLFAEQAWGPTSPLGRSIAGTEESIAGLDRATDPALLPPPLPSRARRGVGGRQPRPRRRRTPRQAVLRPPRLAGRRRRAGRPAARRQAGAGAPRPRRDDPALRAGQRRARHGGASARDDERRFALGVLNTALGGGTSSRLFQEIRERRGLAYSVYSFASHHADSGVVGVAVGCLPAKLDEVLAIVRLELSRVAADGITEDELVRGKGQLRGGLVLGLEDSASRMIRLGKAELIHDELLEIDAVLARIDAVTLDEVRAVAAEVFSREEILAVVGPPSQVRGPRSPVVDLTRSRRAAAASRLAGSATPDDPDDRRLLVVDDRDPEAALREGGRGALDDLGHVLGDLGLEEQVDRPAGQDPLVQQGDLVGALAHPEQVDVEGEDLVQPLDRHPQRGQVDLAHGETSGLDGVGVAALGAVDARLGAVDREELAGLQARADQLGCGTRHHSRSRARGRQAGGP